MSAQWSEADPGAGSPADIRAGAGMNSTVASRAADALGDLSAAGTAREQGWQASASTALASSLTSASAELQQITDQATADANTLSAYASQVESIRMRQTGITSQINDANSRIRFLRRDLELWDDPDLTRRSESRIADTQWRLRGLNAQFDQLATERAAADNAALIALTGTASRGTLASWSTPGAPASVTLAQLASMSETDIATLLAAHPELIDKILAAQTPEQTATWWQNLTLDQQHALVLGGSALIGALGGIPTMVRVAANRINAAVEYRATQREIAQERWFASPRDINDLTVGVIGTSRTLSQLQEKSDYLERVMSGAVQLYLYQPDRDRMVEMVGNPSASTTSSVTYVPGTFSNQYSFYTGDVQQVGRWLNGQDPNMVVFVWHGGEFPGQRPGTAQVDGILAANEAPLALKTGRGLAEFQAEVATDPQLSSARHDAIAHSWGLAATTASELEGARYDHVVSLSGAWMPPGWEGQSNTAYSHYTYTDFLAVAKNLDLVGSGNIPDTNAAFAKPLGDPIPTDGDWTLTLPTSSSPYAASEPVRIPMNTDLAGTHSLVASSDNENLAVLRSVQRDLLQ